MIFVAASCKPDRAETTFRTLLREIERLSEDLTPDELERAQNRLVARTETMADMTRSRRNALAYDLFHHGRPMPIEERVEKIRAVRIEDLRTYLSTHPRDRLSIVTLGPQELPDV
jgi:predicted Zn-dependent peptidase